MLNTKHTFFFLINLLMKCTIVDYKKGFIHYFVLYNEYIFDQIKYYIYNYVNAKNIRIYVTNILS